MPARVLELPVERMRQEQIMVPCREPIGSPHAIAISSEREVNGHAQSVFQTRSLPSGIQIGRKTTRLTHSSASVAVQIRIKPFTNVEAQDAVERRVARTTLFLHELAKVSRHGRLVVSH